MTFKFADMAPTGPGTLAGRYLRHYWQPVYVGKDLPLKRAKPIRILGENFTLYRGESGTAYVVASKCAHRNTQLHTGWVKGDNIRCLYHGWTYNGSGQCVEQPGEVRPFCDKISIRAYPTQEYLGLVFVYLGEGEPPPLPRYTELETSTQAQPFMTAMDLCNWLNRFDNIGDVIHPYFAHPQIPGMNMGKPPTMRVELRPHGLLFYGDYPDGFTQETYLYMPNAVGFPGARTRFKSIGWLVPVDDEHCRTFGVSEIPQVVADAQVGLTTVQQLGEAILRGEMTIDEILDHPAGVSIQDYVALKAQGPIEMRAPEKLGSTDVGVVAVRKLWERELTAFADGASPKRWDQQT